MRRRRRRRQRRQGSSRCRTRRSPSTIIRSPIGRSRPACCRGCRPSPGAVEFGEAYLSWSEQGLALATIGQDYFDIDLFAYDGAFPLVDAYRVELGIDIGAGPRRFTLFFIPPRTKLHDHPEMARAAVRRAGATGDHRGLHRGQRRQSRLFRRRPAPDHGGNGDSVVGARHRRRRLPGTQLRAEIAITSWHRERWMSLSGRPPSAAMNDPEGWRAMRLGNGPQMIETSPASPGAGAGLTRCLNKRNR